MADDGRAPVLRGAPSQCQISSSLVATDESPVIMGHHGTAQRPMENDTNVAVGFQALDPLQVDVIGGRCEGTSA
eukprot:Skav225510  [mRNA]  locus=scaffold1721:284076:284297:+ [translate_table: standard]